MQQFPNNIQQYVKAQIHVRHSPKDLVKRFKKYGLLLKICCLWPKPFGFFAEKKQASGYVLCFFFLFISLVIT